MTETINICQVFRMQHVPEQVRLNQMLMNTVVTQRPAFEVMCGEVFAKLKVTSCLFELGHVFAVKPPTTSLTPRSNCGVSA